MKRISVVFSEEARSKYEELASRAPISKKERMILRSVHLKVGLIKENPFYGDPVAKCLMPDGYLRSYGITNLFRVELPAYWRMLYTLVSGESEGEAIAFILGIIDHKEYDGKFGYAGK